MVTEGETQLECVTANISNRRGPRLIPAEYSEPRVVIQDTPYEAEALKGTHADHGTLHLGRVVWVKKGTEAQSTDQRITVYAEGVGLVTLESRLLGSHP